MQGEGEKAKRKGKEKKRTYCGTLKGEVYVFFKVRVARGEPVRHLQSQAALGQRKYKHRGEWSRE